MRVVLSLIFLGFSCVVFANPAPEPGKYVVADKTYLEKQAKVFELFYRALRVDVPSFPPVVKTVDELIKWLHEHKDWFKKPEEVDTVIEWFTEDYILPESGHFSLVYKEHYEQAIGFLKLFLHVKDTEKLFTFANAIVDFLHHDLWTYAFSVAIIHRPDTQGVELPPIYEHEPYYFFDKPVLYQFYDYKCDAEGDGPFYIKANYSDHHHHHHIYDEQSVLPYYLEDVGISSFLYYLNIYHPFYLGGVEIEDLSTDYSKGKLLFEVVQFLLARYYLERVANHQGSIPVLDYDVNHIVPFDSSLEFPNGDRFPHRPEYVHLTDFYHSDDDFTSDFQFPISHLHHIEAVIHQKFHEKLYEGHHEHDTFTLDKNFTKLYFEYAKHAKHVLGNSENTAHWKHAIPSIIEQPQSALRDPVFYPFLKRLFHYYYEYQNHLTPYTKKQLTFPGVEITDVEIDPLVTYMDSFYTDISKFAHTFCHHKAKSKIFIDQKRLNHKPFTYKIHVKSNADVPVVVRIFLGPKHDDAGRPVNISSNRVHFVPLDVFKWDLKAGASVIKRSSQESTMYLDDQLSSSVFYDKVVDALAGKEEFHIKKEKKYFYFPKRFLLPFGLHQNIPYQIYVYIHKFVFLTPDPSGLYVDNYSHFYPLDRRIKYDNLFVHGIPNSYFKDVTIRYKSVEEAGVSVVQPPH